MGGPDEPSTKSIDASVGGLVWVRRRNGSWWPGRIMGLNEVSESCLVSPRSGTPVKLLGREDASVDWYNLEKSKRVKAFRCGEYDDCIEKAKASAANSSKKAVKYARREDAILHALEIESARLGRDHPDFFSRRRENSCDEHGSSPGESPTMSNSSKENEDMTDETSDSEDESGSAPELSQSGISFEEPNNGAASKVQQPIQGKRRRTPNDSEDDGTEGIKRMRGLEDLGMGVVSKAKVQAVGVPEAVQEDNGLLCGSNTGNCFPNGNPVNGNKGSSSSLKRKRSQVANVHEFLKRKNRRRPLTKVLESTAMVSVPVVCDQFASSNGSPLPGLSDSKVSGIDSNESKKGFSAVINNNSDSTGVSCENGISLNTPENVADASQINSKVKENEISSISGLAENDSSDRLFDVPCQPETLDRLLQMLITRSSGSLRKLCVTGLPSDQSFSFVADHAKHLRTLKLPRSGISNSIVEKVAGRLSSISFLDLSYCKNIGAPALEAIGKHCRHLTWLRRAMHPLEVIDKLSQDEEALAIASTMPKLKHLEMAYLLISTESVLKILANCPELEFLDVRGCWNVKLDEKYVKKFTQLKVIGPLVLGCCVMNDWDYFSDYSSSEDQMSLEDWEDYQSMEDVEMRFYDVFDFYRDAFDWPVSP